MFIYIIRGRQKKSHPRVGTCGAQLRGKDKDSESRVLRSLAFIHTRFELALGMQTKKAGKK